jgi:hypothetical protein
LVLRSKLTKFFVVTVAVVLLATPAFALTYLDVNDSSQMISSRSSDFATQIIATEQWASGGFEVSWEITDNNNGTFDYVYNITATGKEISHIILSLTEDGLGLLDNGTLTSDPGTVVTGPNTFGPGPSNPGIPGDLYGIKWDLDPASTTLEISFTTTRAPVWGDFYAKDGKNSGNFLFAYNVGFSTQPEGSDFDGWIAVPDSAAPLPPSVLLLGSGLFGLGLLGWRRRSG